MSKNKLKIIREKRNMSQSELSRKTDISQAQISRYENNQQINEDSIRKFCKALECKADYLLGLIENEESRVNHDEYKVVYFKEYYLSWYEKILKIKDELDNYPEEVTKLYNIVLKEQFLNSSSHFENLYMITVFTQSGKENIQTLQETFEDVWEGYEANAKFPYLIKDYSHNCGLFVFTVKPKVDLKTIDVYVKISPDYSDDVFLVDAVMENLSVFKANNDYKSYCYTPAWDLSIDHRLKCESKIIDFLTKEEYDKLLDINDTRLERAK